LAENCTGDGRKQDERFDVLFLNLMTIFITKTTATPTTVIMFLLLLGLLFKVFISYFWCSKW
jgi:hypothetical protein